MSNIKTYRVTASDFDWAEVVVEVNLDVLTPDLATEINGFWSGDEWRLNQVDGNPVLAAVRLFGASAISFFMNDGGADIVAHEERDRERWTGAVLDDLGEGWPGVQQLGIRIKRVSVNTVGYDEVELEAV